MSPQLAGFVYALFNASTGLAAGWTDASWGAEVTTRCPLEEGEPSNRRLGLCAVVSGPSGGALALTGPPFRGWWALSFWVQLRAGAPTPLSVRLRSREGTAATAAAAASQPALPLLSEAVELDADTLLGTGRPLPSSNRRRLSQADAAAATAAPWAHVVLPLLRFGDASITWDSVAFELTGAAQLNVTLLQLLSEQAPLSLIKSADTQQLLASGLVSSALSSPPPVPGAGDGMAAAPARALDAGSRLALLAGVSAFVAVAFCVIALAACTLRPHTLARLLRKAHAKVVQMHDRAEAQFAPGTDAVGDAAPAPLPAQAAITVARMPSTSSVGSGASTVPSLQNSTLWQLAQPFRTASPAASQAGSWMCGDTSQEGELPQKDGTRVRRRSTAPPALALVSLASADAPQLEAVHEETAQLPQTAPATVDVEAPQPAAVPETVLETPADIVAGWFGQRPPSAGPPPPPASRKPLFTPSFTRQPSMVERRLTRTGSTVLIEDFELLGLLGEGGEGSVYKARWQGTIVALKKWHDSRMIEENLAGICGEVEVLRKLRHPHVVEFFGACTVPPHLCLVMEFAEGGTLEQLIHGAKVKGKLCEPPPAPPPLPLLHLVSLAEDIASALDYLHSARIVHRDLKPANVLLSATGRAALTDFGISKRIAGDFLCTQHLGAGTYAYSAPEIFAQKEIDERCDQYSFGIVLWEMLTATRPWHTEDGRPMHPMQVITKVSLERERPPIPPSCPAQLRALITALWAPEPSDRPDILSLRHSLAEMRKTASA